MERAPKLTPAALPLIAELGLMLAIIAKREAGIDLINVGGGKSANEAQRREWAMADRDQMTADRLLFTRLDASRELVSTLSTQTLLGCSVQINVAAHVDIISRVTISTSRNSTGSRRQWSGSW